MIRTALILAWISFVMIAPVQAQSTRRPRSSLSEAARGRVGTTIQLDGVPRWLKEYEFQQKKFTFVRIQYDSVGRSRSAWATDFPDADLNLAAQVGSLTRLDVSEPSRTLRFSDPELAKYPFAYLTEPGSLQLSDAEQQSLRNYLKRGGFLMMDDFWGEAEWDNLLSVMKQVFPDREPKEIPLTHPLFHCVFDLQEKPQVPSIHLFLNGLKTERADAQEAHYRGIFDDRGRLMVLICHNTDLADGWERVSVDESYTREVSRAKAFPMGINIVFYALTQSKDTPAK